MPLLRLVLQLDLVDGLPLPRYRLDRIQRYTVAALVNSSKVNFSTVKPYRWVIWTTERSGVIVAEMREIDHAILHP